MSESQVSESQVSGSQVSRSQVSGHRSIYTRKTNKSNINSVLLGRAQCSRSAIFGPPFSTLRAAVLAVVHTEVVVVVDVVGVELVAVTSA